ARLCNAVDKHPGPRCTHAPRPGNTLRSSSTNDRESTVLSYAIRTKFVVISRVRHPIHNRIGLWLAIALQTYQTHVDLYQSNSIRLIDAKALSRQRMLVPQLGGRRLTRP